MLSVNATIQSIPFFGRMFSVEKDTGLDEINSWPSLMIMTSFVWLAIAGLLGLMMPISQLLHFEDSRWFYGFLTAHGAALAFPFLFQLMVGISLHRAGGCMGKRVTGALTSSIYWSMNVGSLLLTLAILLGLNISYAIMYPLPMAGVALGLWSQNVLVLGFTGISLVLVSVVVLYPVQLIKMLFFDKSRQDLLLEPRTLNDPGMLGMAISLFVLLLTGTPIVVVGSTVLLGMYGILPVEYASWAAEPVVFQFAFWIFAHNLMEAMAIMVISAVYAILPLYLADGTRKLYSDRLAKLALWILLAASLTSFFHHFYTMFPALPAALSYHGNFMSWATAIGSALSIFTILATIWQHGLKSEPGIMIALMGFMLYILDGISALVTSVVSWSYQIHGTMWQSGHAMNVLIAIALLWVGVLYHYYPVITGRRLNKSLGNWFVVLYTISAVGMAYAFLTGGAAGMPRRYADWNEAGENWMVFGTPLLIFGLLFAASLVIFAYNLMTAREIGTGTAAPENLAVAASGRGLP